MGIPKIVYHGTSLFRWAMIKNDRKMCADLPKYFNSDKKKSMGYLFFTTDIEDAAGYGVATSLIDMQSLNDPRARFMAFEGRDAIILALKTAPLRNRIELDPEGLAHRKDFALLAETHPRAAQFARSNWYRVKGDISIQHVFAYRATPLDQVDPLMLDAIKAGIVITDINEILLQAKEDIDQMKTGII
jgi:hypothetical protein